MNWVFLALLAPFVYAINVFLDKYLIGEKLPEFRSLPIFSSILAFPVFIILWFFAGSLQITFLDVLLVILGGVFTVWAFALYLEALIKEETSIIIILIQLVPIIVLTLSYFILGEVITLKQFLGFGLLFIVSILVSLKKEKSSFRPSRALMFMLLADFFWALPYILIKFASVSITFTQLVMYESLGVFFGGAILLIFISQIKKAFLITIQKIKKPVLGLVFLNEGLFLLGKILTYLAIAIGPVALVSILGSTQIFFGILLGVSLTLLAPKIFKEDLSKDGLIKKGLLGLLAFVGIILVS